MPLTAKRILVVEDDEGLADLFCELLQQGGACCERAGNAAQCHQWLATHEADLLLVDYSLPDRLAPALVEELRSAGRLRPFIVVTGHGDERVAVEMMKLGARDYLVKDHLVLDRLPVVVKRTLVELEKERQLVESLAALRESEEKFATAFRASPMPMAIRDLDTDRYFDVNDRCLRLMGYSRAEVVGHSPQEIGWMAQEDREKIQSTLAADGGIDGYELRLRRKDGSDVICSYHTHVIQVAGRRCVLSTTIDITARKQAEERLRNQLAELQRWQAVMLGREDRVMQLKREINALATRLGEAAPYPSQTAAPSAPA